MVYSVSPYVVVIRTILDKNGFSVCGALSLSLSHTHNKNGYQLCNVHMGFCLNGQCSVISMFHCTTTLFLSHLSGIIHWIVFWFCARFEKNKKQIVLNGVAHPSLNLIHSESVISFIYWLKMLVSLWNKIHIWSSLKNTVNGYHVAQKCRPFIIIE